jgi:hypothetical protein
MVASSRTTEHRKTRERATEDLVEGRSGANDGDLKDGRSEANDGDLKAGRLGSERRGP